MWLWMFDGDDRFLSKNNNKNVFCCRGFFFNAPFKITITGQNKLKVRHQKE